MSDSIEGVHYIFDRYTFLNDIMEDGGHQQRIDQTSTKEEIRLVVKLAKSLHHPDKVSTAGKKRQAEAAEKTHKIEECQRILLSEDHKQLYDAKLSEFQTHKPSYISRTGVPILIIGDEYLDFQSLLNDSNPDVTKLENMAQQQCGFNPTIFDILVNLYKADPSEANKNAYRDALTTKLTYLSVRETIAWMRAGVNSKKHNNARPLLYADEYSQSVTDEIKRFANNQIEQHIVATTDTLRLGLTGVHPLLLTFNVSSLNEPTGSALVDPALIEDIQRKMRETAQRNFESRAKLIQEIAEEKQAVLEELIELNPLRTLKEDLTSSIHYVYLMAGTPLTAIVAAYMGIQETNFIPDFECQEQNWSEEDILVNHTKNGSIHVIEHNSEISDFWMEIASAFNRIHSQYSQNLVVDTPLPQRAPELR